MQSCSKVVEKASVNKSSLTFPAVSSCRVAVERKSKEALSKLTSK